MPDHALDVARRDANHRLKNALHLAASLLNLQGGRVGDAAMRGQFDAAVERIAVLGMVYGALPPEHERASARRLVESVCRDLGAAARARLTVEVPDAPVSLERAIALALVVHELVGNAVRHAFPERPGSVSVRCTGARGRGWRLEIADDGIGFDAEHAAGFGLELVRIMVGQLRGTLTHTGGIGTTWRIDFPDDALEI